MKIRVFVVKNVLVRPAQMFELNGTSINILRKSHSQPADTFLVIYF